MEEGLMLGAEKVLSQGAFMDLRLGMRIRRGWAQIMSDAKNYNLTEDQVRGFVHGGGLFANDETRKTLATTLGFDWESAAEFFMTIAPIIIEMMAACGL